MEQKKSMKKKAVSWIMYDINWKKLAKSSCKKCHGRGFEGFEVLPAEEEKKLKEENPNWTPALMLCGCASKHWMKLNDEERMNFATLKKNANEMKEKAKEIIQKVVDQEAEKEGIEVEK